MGGGDAIDDTSVRFLLEMALLSPDEVEQLRRAERRKLAREKEEKELEEKREKERQKAEVKETIARLTAEFFVCTLRPLLRLRGRGKRGRRRNFLEVAALIVVIGCGMFVLLALCSLLSVAGPDAWLFGGRARR